jgi:hypothetical protein
LGSHVANWITQYGNSSGFPLTPFFIARRVAITVLDNLEKEVKAGKSTTKYNNDARLG